MMQRLGTKIVSFDETDNRPREISSVDLLLMNVHHLELFYYVARHGGISEAVRQMPYGIQQPAVSGQILKLEESIGGKLFHRRPFALTPHGERLFSFIAPFFANLHEVGGELRGRNSNRLRLAASAEVLRDHVPALLRELKETHPELVLTLRESTQALAEPQLQRGEIDLAITEAEGTPAAGLQSLVLARLPLVLLVREDSPLKNLKSLLVRGERIGLPLISLPPHEALVRNFREGMRQLGWTWDPAIEVTATDLIETYVAEGFGAGLSVAVPGVEPRAGLRRVPLPNFPPLVIAAFWAGKLGTVPEAFLELVRQRAAALRGGKQG